MTARLLWLVCVAVFVAGCGGPSRTILSDPPGAAVYFNNSYVGATPVFNEEPDEYNCWHPGAYTIQKDGYKKQVRQVGWDCNDVNMSFKLDVLTTIKREITSTPDEATIYFGKDLKHKKGSKSEVELGQTPYRDTHDDQSTFSKPTWEAGYYRAVLKGYRPKFIEVNETDKDMKLHFDLTELPKYPEPPRIIFPDPEKVIIQDAKLDTHKDRLLNITDKSRFAIIPFKDSQGTGAGSLVADSLILHLKKQGYEVVDRETIDRVMKEQGMMSERITETDDKELAKKLGKVLSFDYLIVGAITDYSAKSENVLIAPEISKEEKARYSAEYDEFASYYTREVEESARPKFPLTIQQWELEYSSKPKSSYLTIARIGLTSKIIAVDSTKIVWIGLANTTHMNLQSGSKKIVEAMIKDFATPVAVPESKENAGKGAEPIVIEQK